MGIDLNPTKLRKVGSTAALGLAVLAVLSACESPDPDHSGPITPLFGGDITGHIEKKEKGHDLVLLLSHPGNYHYQTFTTHKHKVELVAEKYIENPISIDKLYLDQFSGRRHLVQIAYMKPSGEISVKVLQEPSSSKLHSELLKTGGGLVQAFENYKYSVVPQYNFPIKSSIDDGRIRISYFPTYRTQNIYGQILRNKDGVIESARIL